MDQTDNVISDVVELRRRLYDTKSTLARVIDAGCEAAAEGQRVQAQLDALAVRDIDRSLRLGAES